MVANLTDSELAELIKYLGDSGFIQDTKEFTDQTQLWILVCGFLVFFMHCGFAMLETGAVRAKNAVNILFKNVITVSIGVLGYFVFGYGFAYGSKNVDNNSLKFIGNGNYGMRDLDDVYYHFWFFQMVFAATSATIVSGAVAERTKLECYAFVAFFLVTFVYPVVSHWIWATGGWLSAFTEPGPDKIFWGGNRNSCGMIDFAGSSVVHMVGGFSGLVGAYVIGPRRGRFELLPDGNFGKTLPLPGHNMSLSAIGTMILWFGWFGFNCGSTLSFDGNLAARVAINTAISPSAACLTGITVHYLIVKHWDLGVALNCVLGGLVAVTAPCATVEPWMSVIIGVISAFVYMAFSALLKKVHIDDPLDAFPVHGANGVWGCLAVGLFSRAELVQAAYTTCPHGEGNSNAWQFLTQFVGVCAVAAWSTFFAILIFYACKYTIGVRVDNHHEDIGLDSSEHGAMAYELNMAGDADLVHAEEAKKKHDKEAAAGAEVSRV